MPDFDQNSMGQIRKVPVPAPTDLQRKIYARWNEIEDGAPNISTERLMAMCCNDFGCDCSDVAEALYAVTSAANNNGSAFKFELLPFILFYYTFVLFFPILHSWLC